MHRFFPRRLQGLKHLMEALCRLGEFTGPLVSIRDLLRRQMLLLNPVVRKVGGAKVELLLPGS